MNTPISTTALVDYSSLDLNQMHDRDRAVHDWYRFVLSYPPHLVQHYLEKFGIDRSQRVLDPFCGTGTTVVECKKQGIASIGVEANPMAQFAVRLNLIGLPTPIVCCLSPSHC
jgi:adenine-specific DNA methylase